MQKSGKNLLNSSAQPGKFLDRKTAFCYQNQPDRRPKNDSPFSDNGNRHADAGADRQSFGYKLGSGFVNADDERDEFEKYSYRAADRFKKKRRMNARDHIANAAENEPGFGNSEQMI